MPKTESGLWNRFKAGVNLHKPHAVFESRLPAVYLCRNKKYDRSMLIKASRITNLTDARYFAAKEVDFLGFNLEEGTVGYLDPVYMKAIREWVEGPGIVGEFSKSPAPVVREAAAFFGLDAVQVTETYSAQLPDLKELTVILTIAATGETSSLERLLRESAPYVAYFLLTLPSGIPSDREVEFWKKCCSEYPVLLEADMPEAQLSGLLDLIQPAGLGFTGGEEEQVGVKSFDEIEAIFDMLGR